MDSPRIAVEAADGRTKFGFLIFSDDGAATVTVRFLNPVGFNDIAVPAEKIRGIVGKNLFTSRPHRPDACDTVGFFDHGGRSRYQRKGWIENVIPGGKVVLCLGMDNTIVECWLEELVLLRVGEGFRHIAPDELNALLAKERKELEKIGTIRDVFVADVRFAEDKRERHGTKPSPMAPAVDEIAEKPEGEITERNGCARKEEDQSVLVQDARRAVEKLRAVSARFRNSHPKGA